MEYFAADCDAVQFRKIIPDPVGHEKALECSILGDGYDRARATLCSGSRDIV